MILSYEEAVERYDSLYAINKKIADQTLFKIQRGFYSTTPSYSEVEMISRRFSDGILTMNSAFYIHSLTDVVPDNYFIASRRNATRVRDKKVKQLFSSEKLFPVGKTTVNYNGVTVNVYDKERMLIELLRNKASLPYDYYKEILANYRRIVSKMDIAKTYRYLEAFEFKGKYTEMLEAEVL